MVKPEYLQTTLAQRLGVAEIQKQENCRGTDASKLTLPPARSPSSQSPSHKTDDESIGYRSDIAPVQTQMVPHRHNTKKTYGKSNEQIFHKRWPLSYQYHLNT